MHACKRGGQHPCSRACARAAAGAIGSFPLACMHACIKELCQGSRAWQPTAAGVLRSLQGNEHTEQYEAKHESSLIYEGGTLSYDPSVYGGAFQDRYHIKALQARTSAALASADAITEAVTHVPADICKAPEHMQGRRQG